jgi:hypothetical protein
MKPLFLTQHAWDAVEERKIDPAWIERAVRMPDWIVPDPHRQGVERRFRVISRIRKSGAACGLL